MFLIRTHTSLNRQDCPTLRMSSCLCLRTKGWHCMWYLSLISYKNRKKEECLSLRLSKFWLTVAEFNSDFARFSVWKTKHFTVSKCFSFLNVHLEVQGTKMSKIWAATAATKVNGCCASICKLLCVKKKTTKKQQTNKKTPTTKHDSGLKLLRVDCCLWTCAVCLWSGICYPVTSKRFCQDKLTFPKHTELQVMCTVGKTIRKWIILYSAKGLNSVHEWGLRTQ